MRYKTRTVLAFSGIVATVAVAVSLAFVSGGRAASPNVCVTPTVNGSAASCVTELVAPHFISAPGTDGVPNDAISFTKFKNESGAGGATATHLVISVSFSSPVTVKFIALSVNGSSASLTGCSPSSLPALSTSSVSCPAGNIAGNGTVKLTVRFSASATTTLTGAAAYGEGPGNPGNPPNDYQQNIDTLTVGDGSAGGGCFDLTTNSATVTSGLTGTQGTAATVGAGAGFGPPLCTFVDAGVRTGSSAFAGLTQTSFVEFPTFASGYATVSIILRPVPSGFSLNKSPIFEDTHYAAPYFTTKITVPNCDKAGNIVGPVGNPPLGAVDPAPVNDTCIFNRSSLPKGGGQIDMHVIGSPADGSYQG